MTLIVATFKIDPNTGEMITDPFSDKAGTEMAGPDSWRSTIWGSSILIEMGATFFPSLKASDLYIENIQLESFEQECKMLLANSDKLVDKLGISSQAFSSRLENIIYAIVRAKSDNCGVYIG